MGSIEAVAVCMAKQTSKTEEGANVGEGYHWGSKDDFSVEARRERRKKENEWRNEDRKYKLIKHWLKCANNYSIVPFNL